MRPAYTALFLVAVVVAACSAGSGAPTEGARTGEVWREATLRDVVSGAEFAISDLQGKVVVIETMAVWCITCRFQQREAREALARVNSADVVYLSLDVDPRERAEDLAAYAQREGFTWRFAVASPEVSRSLAATFGDQILSPPSTPLVVLAPDGRVVEQHIGIKSAADLAALIVENLP